MRLDRRLRALHPDLSWTRIRDAIAKGQVLLDGVVTREEGLEVAEDAFVVLDLNRRAMARPGARLDLPRLHEDEHVLVVDKPAGLLTIATAPELAAVEDSVLRRVREYVKRARGSRAYAGVLHRLDRDTSGALALALSRDVHAAGREMFKAHRFERTYLALVQGVPDRDHGTVRARISSEYRGGRRAVVDDTGEGLDAITHYRVRERHARSALMELTLETGRQHQIRLHMQQLGHPLIGERVYRDDEESAHAPAPPRRGGRGSDAPRQMLHAYRLAFPHPVTGERIDVTAPMPPDFVRVLERLRREYHARP